MKTPAPVSSRLHPTPGNPLPEGIESGVLETRDGKMLRYAVCPSRGARMRGTILLAQGRNEAIEKYFETIDDLCALGFAVVTFDWRGQGGSQRLLGNPAKGHAVAIEDFAEDLVGVLDTVALKLFPPPVVILAHSMGGLVALAASNVVADRVERLVLTAPLVGLPMTRGGLRLRSGAARLFRLLGLGSASAQPALRKGRGWTFATSPLTSDPDRFKRNLEMAQAAPHLFVGAPTIAWFDTMARTMAEFEDSDVIADLSIPTLFLVAGSDRVVSPEASERLAWRMRCGHALVIPFARHELLQEADRYRAPAIAAIDRFLTGLPPVVDREAIAAEVEAALADVAAE